MRCASSSSKPIGHRDLPGMARGQRLRARARARGRPCPAPRAAPAAAARSSAPASDQVDALLVREAAHHAEQRHVRVDAQAHALLQRRLVGALRVERGGVVARGDQADRSPGPRPRSSMPLRMPLSASRRWRSRPSSPQPCASVWISARVGRAHGGDGVGAGEAALEEGHAAVELEPSIEKSLCGSASPASACASNRPWKARLWTVIRLAAGIRLALQVERRQRRRPVVAMHDVRTPVERAVGAAQQRGDARQQRRSAARCPASPRPRRSGTARRSLYRAPGSPADTAARRTAAPTPGSAACLPSSSILASSPAREGTVRR